MSDWREIAGDQNLRLSAQMLEQAGQIADLKKKAERLARGLLEIAEHAMPDTYYLSDSRCELARAVLGIAAPDIPGEVMQEALKIHAEIMGVGAGADGVPEAIRYAYRAGSEISGLKKTIADLMNTAERLARGLLEIADLDGNSYYLSDTRRSLAQAVISRSVPDVPSEVMQEALKIHTEIMGVDEPCMDGVPQAIRYAYRVGLAQGGISSEGIG